MERMKKAPFDTRLRTRISSGAHFLCAGSPAHFPLVRRAELCYNELLNIRPARQGRFAGPQEVMAMELNEQQLSTKTVYQGLIVNVTMDEVRLINGKTSRREVVEHPGGVAILPLDDEGRVITVRQFRYPFRQVLTEIPAGKLERGEDPLAAARRELSEEIGAAGTLTPMGHILSSPGFCSEKLYLYLARDLTFGPCHPDEDEFLEICPVPFQALYDAVVRGDITDGKTAVAVLKAKAILEQEKEGGVRLG